MSEPEPVPGSANPKSKIGQLTLRVWRSVASTVRDWLRKLRQRFAKQNPPQQLTDKPIGPTTGGDSAPKSSWPIRIAKVIGIPLLLAAGLIIKQCYDRPIAIESITVDSSATALGISGEAIADEIKAKITEINSEAGELFQGRKLGDATVPLDVTIEGLGMKISKVTEAVKLPLTSARVNGQLSKIDNCLTLQTTTSREDRVTVDVIRVPMPQSAGTAPSPAAACVDLPDPHARKPSVEQQIADVMAHVKNAQRPALPPEPLLQKMDDRILCLALRVVVSVSPDVAANYLFKRWEGDEARSPDRDLHSKCGVKDDVSLYSQVAEDADAPSAERANALVGLSLVYARQGEVYEELNLAQAAAELIDHAIACDGLSAASRWQYLKCRWQGAWNFRKNKRSAIAAWMQLGAARSDYIKPATANINITGHTDSMRAYDRAIAVDKDYPPAYDAKGNQEVSLIEEDQQNHERHARNALRLFKKSLRIGETPAAHNDLGWLYIYHRDEFTGKSERVGGYYPKAMTQFRMAIRLWPDYWEAHKGLGFALFYSDEFQEAYDVLKPAVEHQETDTDLLRFLGLTEGRFCKFEQARNHFILAYQGYEKAHDDAGIGNTLTDWGQVLYLSGLVKAAIKQETEAIDKDEHNHYARMWRGRFELNMPCPGAGKAALDCQSNSLRDALADLKRAAHDDDKDDFVLSAYLDALNANGHADTAITVYEAWSGSGKVPKLGRDITHQPNVDVRLSYARALLQIHKWEQALAEFDMLAWVGSRYSPEDVADLKEQARLGGADAITLSSIDSIVRSARPKLPLPEKCVPPFDESIPLRKVSIH